MDRTDGDCAAHTYASPRCPGYSPAASPSLGGCARNGVAGSPVGGALVFGVGAGGGYFDFEALGEISPPKKLAELLDEGLDVLTGLWSGTPYQHEGAAYHIKEACFLPRPLQSPRIPIWVAGMWPLKAPLRRAAHWDGIIPIGRDLPLTSMLTPQQMQVIVAYVRAQPEYAIPFDIVHMGITAGKDAVFDHEVVTAYQRVGVTWWVEKILPECWGSWTNWPLEAMQTRLRQGPPGKR